MGDTTIIGSGQIGGQSDVGGDMTGKSSTTQNNKIIAQVHRVSEEKAFEV